MDAVNPSNPATTQATAVDEALRCLLEPGQNIGGTSFAGAANGNGDAIGIGKTNGLDPGKEGAVVGLAGPAITTDQVGMTSVDPGPDNDKVSAPNVPAPTDMAARPTILVLNSKSGDGVDNGEGKGKGAGTEKATVTTTSVAAATSIHSKQPKAVSPSPTKPAKLPTSAQLLRAEYAPFATHHYALHCFRKQFGKTFLRRSLTVRKNQTHRRACHATKNQTPTQTQAQAQAQTQAQQQSQTAEIPITVPAPKPMPRRSLSSSSSSIVPLTYASLHLNAVTLWRLSGRKGKALVGKSLPLEVFVYYSDDSRGCIDDVFVVFCFCWRCCCCNVMMVMPAISTRAYLVCLPCTKYFASFPLS